jgi:hypothetical protein
MWKSYPQNRWKTREKDVLTRQVRMTVVENLSTKPVDKVGAAAIYPLFPPGYPPMLWISLL